MQNLRNKIIKQAENWNLPEGKEELVVDYIVHLLSSILKEKAERIEEEMNHPNKDYVGGLSLAKSILLEDNGE